MFFENTRCVRCNYTLAYVPELARVAALEEVAEGIWRTPSDGARYRLCDNYRLENVCNWAVPAASPERLCGSCRLTTVVPNLEMPGHREAWFKLEAAKRRLLYTLAQLGCPLRTKAEDPEHGLEYRLLASEPGSGPVLTGHADGTITVNVDEADDAKRERQRMRLHEPYRTLLGHFRHESGHYFWDRLVAGDDARLEGFRALFGDERADYATALERHYSAGPPVDWQERFISSYAAAHPWEDWAESWAHYLHMTDMLETADESGLLLRPKRRDEPSLPAAASAAVTPAAAFESLLERWFPLTYVLNNLNRSMGLPDGYPFVLSTPVIAKLRAVHETLAAAHFQGLPVTG